jgi:transposase
VPPTLRRPSTASRSPHKGCCAAVTVTSPGNDGRNTCSLCGWFCPGRKTDVKDAEWLCQLLEAGLLRASFVPPKPIRALRQRTRYRNAQIEERQREAIRLHKALEDTGIKLDCVATDILGRSGRDMLDALCSGTTDPEVLADLARGKAASEDPRAQAGLEGRFEPLHALLVGSILAHLDFLDEQIERLSDAIEEQLRPFGPAAELLRSVDGIETRTAQNILAEIGLDMSVFPTAGHLASWAGQCPGNDQSAGKRRSGRTREGSKWLNGALKDAAMGAINTNDSYLQAQYQRLRPRVGHGRALGAVKHSILCALLAHASNRRALPRPRRRLLPQARPRATDRRLVAQLERLRAQGEPRSAPGGRLS